MNPIELIAYGMIIISAVFKGIALKNLSNKQIDAKIAQKNYMRWNIISYAFLFPGLGLWAYINFFA